MDLPGLDLTEGDLFLHIVDDHHEMLTFLGVCAIVVGHGDYGAVVLHDDRGEVKRYSKFLAESDDEVDFLGEGEDCPSFGVSRRSCNRSLLGAAIVKCTVGTVERYCVTCVAFAVRV